MIYFLLMKPSLLRVLLVNKFNINTNLCFLYKNNQFWTNLSIHDVNLKKMKVVFLFWFQLEHHGYLSLSGNLFSFSIVQSIDQ